jgi:hypothetical protein
MGCIENKMKGIKMRTIRSSWNSDRVAAAFCNRRVPKRTAPRLSALYAQYQIGSDMVSVFTRRGRKVFTRHFGDTILSACVSGDQLRVETANGGHFVCDAWTGKLLESEEPLKPAICAGILNAA